jgi:hypothetical protein
MRRASLTIDPHQVMAGLVPAISFWESVSRRCHARLTVSPAGLRIARGEALAKAAGLAKFGLCP